MKRDTVLHILRNPHGWRHGKVRQASIEAADIIEALTKDRGKLIKERDEAREVSKQ